MSNYLSSPPQQPPQITCNRCTSLFGRKYEYDRHIADVHAPKCVCRYCGKQISSRKDKKRDHLRHKHKISWTGSPDSQEESFLDQHYFRGVNISPLSSSSNLSSPLSPPQHSSPRLVSQALRIPEFPLLSNTHPSGNDQDWGGLQHQILSFPESDFASSSNNAAAYGQNNSGHSFQAPMRAYNTQGIGSMPPNDANISYTVPRNSMNIPARASMPYRIPSLDPSPIFQDFSSTLDWASAGPYANDVWNVHPPQ